MSLFHAIAFGVFPFGPTSFSNPFPPFPPEIPSLNAVFHRSGPVFAASAVCGLLSLAKFVRNRYGLGRKTTRGWVANGGLIDGWERSSPIRAVARGVGRVGAVGGEGTRWGRDEEGARAEESLPHRTSTSYKKDIYYQ
jgi:hypothetical protein